MATSRQKNGIFGLLMGTITFGVLFALAFFVVTSVLSVLTLGGAIAVAIAIAALVGGMAYKLKPFRETEKGEQPKPETDTADTTEPPEPTQTQTQTKEPTGEEKKEEEVPDEKQGETQTQEPTGEEKKGQPVNKLITIGSTSLGKFFSLTQETKELTLTKANTYPVIKAEAKAKAKTEAKAKSASTPQSYLLDMLKIVKVEGELRGYFIMPQSKHPLSNTFLFLFFDVLAKIEKTPKMSVEDQWFSLISVCEKILENIAPELTVGPLQGIAEFRKDLQDFLTLNKNKYQHDTHTIPDLGIKLPEGPVNDSWEKFKNIAQHAAGLKYAKETFGIDPTGEGEAIKVTSLGLIT